jgi:hypothetical protein
MITVEEAIKKNLLHKGKKSHFIYMKEKNSFLCLDFTTMLGGQQGSEQDPCQTVQ